MDNHSLARHRIFHRRGSGPSLTFRVKVRSHNDMRQFMQNAVKRGTSQIRLA